MVILSLSIFFIHNKRAGNDCKTTDKSTKDMNIKSEHFITGQSSQEVRTYTKLLAFAPKKV